MATLEQLSGITDWLNQNPNYTEDQAMNAFNSYNAGAASGGYSPISMTDVQQQRANWLASRETPTQQAPIQTGTNLVKDVTQSQINTTGQVPNYLQNSWLGQLQMPQQQQTQPQNYLTLDQLSSWWQQNNPMNNFQSSLDSWWQNKQQQTPSFAGGDYQRQSGNRGRYFNTNTGDYQGLGSIYSQQGSL